MPVHVLQLFSLIWLLNVLGPLSPPASDFVQSIEAFERHRVITPQERIGLETGRVGVPFDPNTDRRLVVMEPCLDRSVPPEW